MTGIELVHHEGGRSGRGSHGVAKFITARDGRASLTVTEERSANRERARGASHSGFVAAEGVS